MTNYPCAKFGDFGLSRFGMVVRTDTDTQTASQNHGLG